MRNLFLLLTEVVEQAPEVVEKTEEVVEETLSFWQIVCNIFTPDLIATIISIITTLGVVFKLVKIVRQLAKANKGTIEDVIKAVQSKMDEENDVNIAKVISPLVEKMGKIENTEEILIKVLALMQEQSSSSKLAILELLQNVGQVKDTTIEDAKKEVEKQEVAKKENEDKAIKELEEIEKQEETLGRI